MTAEIMGKGAAMVSSGEDRKNIVPPWLRPIGSIKFYQSCNAHSSKKCNFYCKVCMVALCNECKAQHDLPEHEIVMAYNFRSLASFRMEDLERHWDISDICPYSKHKWLLVIIHKRGDGIARPRHGAKCESCHYLLKAQPPGTKYCSVECKVEAGMKMNGSGSGSAENEANRQVETKSEGSSSNVQSFGERPRK